MRRFGLLCGILGWLLPGFIRAQPSELPLILRPIQITGTATSMPRPGLEAVADFRHESSLLGSRTVSGLRVSGQATTPSGTHLAGMLTARHHFAVAPGLAPNHEQSVALVVAALHGPNQWLGAGAITSSPLGTTAWAGLRGESTTGRSTYGLRADVQATQGEPPAYSVAGYVGMRY